MSFNQITQGAILQREFTEEERSQRVFNRAALVMFESWQENWRHSRILDEPLIPNHVITVGSSKNGAEHREHVIPLALIRDRCEKMFAAGSDLSAMAAFLKRHVKIVMISREERTRLDFELGLKITMPPGWSFEDENADVFARLRVARIEWS
jgi:hypothetical protein